MKPGDGLTVARWLHAADGRPADDVAEWAWSELLEGIEVEDAIDVIVEHYRQSDEMLPACDLLSRATVHGFLRETRELELLATKRDRKARPRDGEGAA